MIAASDPNLLIAKLAVAGLLAVFSYRFILWVRDAPLTPDPWDAETDKRLSDPETLMACHHCSAPQNDDAWFCPHCGSAVGPYNNLMPYVNIFSEGEVFRNGLNQRFQSPFLIATGFVLITVTSGFIMPLCFLLMPIYLLLFFKGMHHSENQKSDEIQ